MTVIDDDGKPLDVQVTSSSGFNYINPAVEEILPTTTVSEPGSGVALGAALLALAARARRRKSS